MLREIFFACSVASSSVRTNPLTLTLSPSDGEREKQTPRSGRFKACRQTSDARFARSRRAILPLPFGRGEGRGEGKFHFHPKPDFNSTRPMSAQDHAGRKERKPDQRQEENHVARVEDAFLKTFKVSYDAERRDRVHEPRTRPTGNQIHHWRKARENQ